MKKTTVLIIGIFIVLLVMLFSSGAGKKLVTLFNNQEIEEEEDDLAFEDSETKPNITIKEEKKEGGEVADIYKAELAPKEEIEEVAPPVNQPPKEEPKEKSAVDAFYKFNPAEKKVAEPIEKEIPKEEVIPKKAESKPKPKPKKAKKVSPKIVSKPSEEEPEEVPVPSAEVEPDLDSMLADLPEEQEVALPKEEEPPAVVAPPIEMPKDEEPPVFPKEEPEAAPKDEGEIDLKSLGLEDFVEDKGFVEEPKDFIPTDAPEKESLTPADYDKYNVILSITPKYEGSIFSIELQGTKEFTVGNRNAKANAKIFKLKAPYRTAIDFINAKFASIPETIEISHIESPIEKITTKYFEEKGKGKERTIARVIIHLKRQAIFKKDLASSTLLKISFR